MKKKTLFVIGIAFSLMVLAGMLVLTKPAIALVCSAASCTDTVLWSSCFGATDETDCTSSGGACSGGNCILRSCSTTSNTCPANSTGCSSLACQEVAVTYSCSGPSCIQSLNYSAADYCGGCSGNNVCQSGSCVAPTPTLVPCGALGQICCGGSNCNAPLTCIFGACENPPPTPTPLPVICTPGETRTVCSATANCRL